MHTPEKAIVKLYKPQETKNRFVSQFFLLLTEQESLNIIRKTLYIKGFFKKKSQKPPMYILPMVMMKTIRIQGMISSIVYTA